MKPALTAIVVAGLGLGMMAPEAFAASGPTWHKSNIQIGSYVANGVFDYYAVQSGTETTFMPVYYVLQALKSLGYSHTYNGKVLNIITPSGVTPDTSNITLGTGNLTIEINGTPVKMVDTQTYKDPASGAKAHLTTYIPIFYIQQILDAVQVHNSWDGTNWTGQQVAIFITGNNTISIGGQDNLALSLKDTAGNAITPKAVRWSVAGTGAVIDPMTGRFMANQTGIYTVTATADGLSASAQVAVYGAAASFKVSNPTAAVSADTAYADQAGGGTPVSTVTVAIVDQNGNPVPYTGTLNVTTETGGDLTVGPANAQTTVLNFSNSATATFNVYGNTVQASNKVGTTTFDITDPNHVFPTMTTSVAITAGNYASAKLVGGNPNLMFTIWTSTSVSYQLYDAEGNPLALAGVPITFTATAGGRNGANDSATIGGQAITATTPATVTVSTDTNGVATVPFSTSANLGASWTVAVSNINHATTPVAGTGIETILKPRPAPAIVATTMTLGTVTVGHYGSPSNADYNTVATVKDQNGNTIASSNLTGSNFTVKLDTTSFTYSSTVPSIRTASNLFTYDSATGTITLYLGTGTTIGVSTIYVTYGAASATIGYVT